jgi:hypothetical protein
MGPTDPKGPATTQQTQGAKAPDPVVAVPPTVRLGVPSPAEWHPSGTLPDGRPATGVGGYREGRSVEDVAARTPYSTEFSNPDGSRTRQIFEQVTYVPDAAGGLHPVDVSLRRDPGDGRLEPARSLSSVSFATTSAAPDVARLDLGDGVSLGFGLAGAAAVPVTVEGDAAVYRGVRPDADLELSATTFGLKESIVLWSAKAPTSWLFPLRSLGATPSGTRRRVRCGSWTGAATRCR